MSGCSPVAQLLISSCRALQPRREVVKPASKGELLKGTNTGFIRWVTIQHQADLSLMFMENKEATCCIQHIFSTFIWPADLFRQQFSPFHMLWFGCCTNQDTGLTLLVLHVFQFCTGMVKHSNVINLYCFSFLSDVHFPS